MVLLRRDLSHFLAITGVKSFTPKIPDGQGDFYGLPHRGVAIQFALLKLADDHLAYGSGNDLTPAITKSIDSFDFPLRARPHTQRALFSDPRVEIAVLIKIAPRLASPVLSWPGHKNAGDAIQRFGEFSGQLYAPNPHPSFRTLDSLSNENCLPLA